MPAYATVNHGVGRYVSERGYYGTRRPPPPRYRLRRRVEYLEDIVYGSPAPLPTHAQR